MWQPINTAPKDGTRVLLVQGDLIGVGRWHLEESGHWATISEKGGKRTQEWEDTSSGWWEDVPQDMYEPTHWMPLPAPPTVTK